MEKFQAPSANLQRSSKPQIPDERDLRKHDPWEPRVGVRSRRKQVAAEVTRRICNAPRFWFCESAGPRHYAEVGYSPDDYLVFGRETAGLPRKLLEDNRDWWLRIPMFNDKSRSLNLSNCAAVVLFEALRQQGFGGEA